MGHLIFVLVVMYSANSGATVVAGYDKWSDCQAQAKAPHIGPYQPYAVCIPANYMPGAAP
jgi:hypothetical protein